MEEILTEVEDAFAIPEFFNKGNEEEELSPAELALRDIKSGVIKTRPRFEDYVAPKPVPSGKMKKKRNIAKASRKQNRGK